MTRPTRLLAAFASTIMTATTLAMFAWLWLLSPAMTAERTVPTRIGFDCVVLVDNLILPCSDTALSMAWREV